MPNPGKGSAGGVLIDKDLDKIWLFGKYLGDYVTNNQAELSAIFRSLSLFRELDKTGVIYSDSQYAVGLVSGKTKPVKNLTLYYSLRALKQRTQGVTFEWLPAEKSKVLTFVDSYVKRIARNPNYEYQEEFSTGDFRKVFNASLAEDPLWTMPTL